MTAAHHRFRCQPAFTVIRALGGARALADMLGVSTEAVSQWNRPASKGGSGGYVPKKHWAMIVANVNQRKDRPILWKLLECGKREKLDVGRASKQKGDRFEFQVVRELVDEGFPNAHRVPLSGAVKGYPGDVLVRGTKTGDWVIQCKINKKETGGGRGGVAKFLSEVSIGRIVTKSGAVFVAMSRGVFLGLMAGVKPLVANMPELAYLRAPFNLKLMGFIDCRWRVDNFT